MPTVSLTPTQQAKKKRGLCIHSFCSKKALPKRNLCSKHMMRRYAANNPLMYKFNNKRNNARRDGIEFTLTFPQFETLAMESGYNIKSGRKKRSLHIDRIDPLKGYTLENCRVINCNQNSRKGATVDKAAYAEARKNGLSAVDAFASSKPSVAYDSDTYKPDIDCGF